MIHIRRIAASGPLRGVVRGFQQRVGMFEGPGVIMPLSARPDQFIEVYFEAPYLARINGEPFATAPDTVVVGPQVLRRTELLMRGSVGAFNVSFQPTGFNRLFGLPMPSLLDAAEADKDMGIPALTGLGDAIRKSRTFAERVAAAEAWLGARLQTARSPDEIDHAARRVRRAPGAVRIDRLARDSGLSERQFHRRFTHQVGVDPKLYARTVRFDALLSDRQANPDQTWTTLAHAYGYFDQAHLLKDFHAFAGEPPGDFRFERPAPDFSGPMSDPY